MSRRVLSRQRFSFGRGFDWRRLTWSPPDSPSPAVCSYCSGALPEVPLMIWNEQGAAVSLCDDCVERYMVIG